LASEIGQSRQTQTAAFRIHHLLSLQTQAAASLTLLLHACLAGLRSLRTLKAALTGPQQSQTLVITLQSPVATSLEQLLLLAVREVRVRQPSARGGLRKTTDLLQGSSCQGNTGNQECSSPAIGERHEDRQQ
jgi:hypothetical protein